MLMRGERMSKTRGNILDPEVATGLFGVDGVRYLVLREIPFDRDGDVTADGLVRRYNADLANDLGNLVNRTVSMSTRYLSGALPPLPLKHGAAPDIELRAAAGTAFEAYTAAMASHHLDEALGAVMELTRRVNGYAESQAPWALNAAGDTQRVGEVVGAMAEACRILGHLIAPFTPATARALHEQLGAPPPYDARGAGGPRLEQLVAWGSGPTPWRSGAAQPLFPRVELPADDPAGNGSAS